MKQLNLLEVPRVYLPFKETKQYVAGEYGERWVEKRLKQCGYSVLAPCRIENAGAPSFSGQDGVRIVADLDVLVPKSKMITPSILPSRIWVECKVKRKSVPYMKAGGEPRHGFSRRLFNQYLLLESETRTPVYIAIYVTSEERVLMISLQDMKLYGERESFPFPGEPDGMWFIGVDRLIQLEEWSPDAKAPHTKDANGTARS